LPYEILDWTGQKRKLPILLNLLKCVVSVRSVVFVNDAFLICYFMLSIRNYLQQPVFSANIWFGVPGMSHKHICFSNRGHVFMWYHWHFVEKRI